MFNSENKTMKLPCGADMYYAKFGKGSKNLVMIPGLNIVDMEGTAGNLAYFYRKFAKEFTVYIFGRRSGRDRPLYRARGGAFRPGGPDHRGPQLPVYRVHGGGL